MRSFDMGRVPSVSFGPGRMAEAPDRLAMLGARSVLVVADAALADLGQTDRLQSALEDAGLTCTMAAEIAGEPKEAHVDTLCDRARVSGAAAVIGFGGGAAMDAAKLVATIAPSGRPAAQFALARPRCPETACRPLPSRPPRAQARK